MRVLAHTTTARLTISGGNSALFSIVPARLPAPHGLLSGVPLRSALAADSGRVQWRIITPTAADILSCQAFLRRTVYAPNGGVLSTDEQEISAARLYRDPVIAFDIDDYCATHTVRVVSTSSILVEATTWLWLDDGVQFVQQHETPDSLHPQQLAVLLETGTGEDSDPESGWGDQA